MAKHDLVSVERSGSESAEPRKAEKIAYGATELFVVGAAVDLVQGPMLDGPYFDRYESGRSYWPT